MPSAMKLISAFSLNSLTIYATSRMTRAFGSTR